MKWQRAAQTILDLVRGDAPAFALALAEGFPLPLAIGIRQVIEQRARASGAAEHELQVLHAALRGYFRSFEYNLALVADQSCRYDIDGNLVAEATAQDRANAAASIIGMTRGARSTELKRVHQEGFAARKAAGQQEAMESAKQPAGPPEPPNPLETAKSRPVLTIRSTPPAGSSRLGRG